MFFGGRPVMRLRHGTYTILVRDRSARYGFRLWGPSGGTRVSTTRGFRGEESKRVFLHAADYRYANDRLGRIRAFRVL
jgi:hypothetical protein